MSCVYQIDSRRRLIHLIIEGQVLGEELVAFERNLQADPQYDPDFDQLADVRRWLPPVADLDTLQELARGLAPSSKRRIAIVVASALLYGVSREFAGLANLAPSRFGLFYRLGEARNWLRVERGAGLVPPSLNDTV
jgi:hypothetical protein